MTPRTSLTHPLAIAGVAAGAGRIGLTFCPGKVQPRAATGAWARDLGVDLDAIAAWGAVAVVTLVGDGELADLGVSGMGEAVRSRHMDWLHLPIVDGSVPDAGCCQFNANRSPPDAVCLASTLAQLARICHSARAAERRSL